MAQSKTLFFVIIGVALLAVIAMVFVSLFWAGSIAGLSPLQQETEIEVVVAPSIALWAEETAQKYNQANPNSQVTIVPANELIPSARFQPGQQTVAPAAWLAEAAFVVDMAASDGYEFTNPQSVATTELAWGGYVDKLEQFNQDFGPVGWQAINSKATDPQGVKLVIAAPQNSAEGLAALISGVSTHLGKQSLSEQDIGQADAWLTETLGNRNAQTPPRPAEAFAGVQGRTLGDLGILSTASWQQVGLDSNSNFVITPVTPTVTLDYPFVVWAGDNATPEGQQAAEAFGKFLLEPAQQEALVKYSLATAVTNSGNVQIDGRAARRLMSWAERELR